MSGNSGAPRYDLILLDADGTLFDFDAAARAAFDGALAAASVFAPTDSLWARYRTINYAIWEELERGEIDKESLKAERFRRLFAEAGLSPDVPFVSDRFLKLLAQGTQLIPGAEAFVAALAASGARLAVVTNGISAVQRGRFARSSLGTVLTNLLISEELGAEKPARFYFEEAFRRLGRPETEKAGVALVGDSWTADIAGALGFGLDAVWFNPEGKARPPLAAGLDAGRLSEARSYAEALSALGLSPA